MNKHVADLNDDSATAPPTTGSARHGASAAEPVIFCRRGEATEGDALSGIAVFRHIATLAAAFIIGITLKCTALALRLPWPGDVVFLVVAAGWVGLVVWHERRWRVAISSVPIPDPPPDARLVCVAPPDWILRHGELCDVPFEPRVFRAGLTGGGRPSSWMIVTGITAFALAVAIGGAALYFLGFDIDGPFQFIPPAATIAIAATLALWPTYYRLVPGRLDVMRFSPLRREPVAVRRYYLRACAIEVNLRYSIVALRREVRSGRPDEVTTLSFFFTRRRTEFAHALLLAAISTRVAPPLPDDELLG